MPSIFPHLPRPLLFAHRGNSIEAPENTAEAFSGAVAAGADVVETDAHVSADGEVVLFHDPSLQRTTDGAGAVASHTMAQLERLDAGFHFRNRTGDLSFRGKGLRIPRLIDMLREFPDMAFNVELKTIGAVQQVLSIAATCDPARIVLTSGDHRIIEQLELGKPACGLGLSKRQAFMVLRACYAGGSLGRYADRALQIPPRYHNVIPVATRRLLAKARQVGLETHIWTINGAAAAQRWLRRGVDGVMSDDPNLMRPLIRAAQQVDERAHMA